MLCRRAERRRRRPRSAAARRQCRGAGRAAGRSAPGCRGHRRGRRSWSSDRRASGQWPGSGSPLCAARLWVGGDDGAVDQGVFEVRLIGQAFEDARKDAALHPATKTLETAVPVAEPARQVAPGHARSHAPQHRLKEQPIVFGRRPRIGGLAGQQRGDLLPDRVAHHEPRPLKHCPNPAKTEREARPVSRGNPQCQQALVGTLIDLHRQRWTARHEPGVLGTQEVQRFHLDAAPRLLAAEMLRLYGLRIQGRVIGVYYGFAHRGRAYGYLSGFDPGSASQSPGTVLLAHAIREAAREGCREFHFLRGQEPYKYAWGAVDRWNRRRSLCPTDRTDG